MICHKDFPVDFTTPYKSLQILTNPCTYSEILAAPDKCIQILTNLCKSLDILSNLDNSLHI